MQDTNPESMFDLERYPLADLESRRIQELVFECRSQLEHIGAVELPGFLKRDAVGKLAQEADALAAIAFYNAETGNAYLEAIDPSLPDSHPKRKQETSTFGVVAYDQFLAESSIRKIYESELLLNFLCKALGKKQLYRYADPLGALNLSVMRKGDYLRWHFDQTDFVSSLCLQSPENGGHFEFVPMIRKRGAENYAEVAKVLRGSKEIVQKLNMVPGTLLLFEGRHSLHRVSTVEGDRLRHVLLLGYDTKPGVKSSAYLQFLRYGRTKDLALENTQF